MTAAQAPSGAVTEGRSATVSLVTSGGLRAIDAGALRRARELEAIGFLQLTLAVGEKIGWTGGFGIVTDKETAAIAS